jgi:hypothetical protein
VSTPDYRETLASVAGALDPSPADYREVAQWAYDAADDMRSRWGLSALDALGWELERAAQDLEELEGA